MKSNWIWVLFATAMTLSACTAFGEDDDDAKARAWKTAQRGVPPVTNASYQTECGICHMAYSPGLLPARSWERMMSNLADHFGDNAELPEKTRETITRYLVDNGADKVQWRRSMKIDRSIGAGETPLRISETGYFVRKHDEIPDRMVRGNPQVKSWANCAACHQGAEKGSFSDDHVRIPGFEKAHF